MTIALPVQPGSAGNDITDIDVAPPNTDTSSPIRLGFLGTP